MGNLRTTPHHRTRRAKAATSGQDNRKTFRIAPLTWTALACVGVVAMAHLFISQSRKTEQTKPTSPAAIAPAKTVAFSETPAEPTFVVENTLFGRRIRRIEPKEAANADRAPVEAKGNPK